MPDTLAITQFSDTPAVPNDTVLHATTVRYDGRPLSTAANNENWVFSVVLILFILLIVGVNRSYNWIVEAFRNITKVRNRSSIFSKTTAEEYQSRSLIVFFATGAISLYLYINLFSDSQLSLSAFLMFFLAGLVFLFIKTQIMNFLAYVFVDAEVLKLAKENYFNSLSLLGFLLYPLLILGIYTTPGINNQFLNLMAIIVSLSVFFFMTVKLFRIFLHKILDFFHIMLYLCTLEILPLLGMFQVYKLIIKEF